MSRSRPTSRSLCRLAVLALLLAGPSGLLGASASAAAGTTGPTARQERIVLDLVDDLCGDTWCEGDHAFDFRSFTCDAERRRCTLRLRIAVQGESPLQWRWRSGHVHGFVRYRQMVHVADGGHRSLTPAFTDAMHALIARVEASVPRSS